MRILVLAVAAAACTGGGGDSDATLHVTFAGDGVGFVKLGDQECSATCDLAFHPPLLDLVSGTLLALSPSISIGFSGDCVSNSNQCTTGPDPKQEQVVATFSRDDGEIQTLLPPAPIEAGTFTPDGDLVIASTGRVSRLGLDGTERWASSLLGYDFAAISATADSIVAVANESVVALSATGTIVWSVPIGETDASPLARFPDGKIAALGTTTITVLNSDGQLAWTTMPSCRPAAGAVDSTGTLAVACGPDILRFDGAGGALASWPIPNGEVDHARVAFDSHDRLVLHGLQTTLSQDRVRVLVRWDVSGTSTTLAMDTQEDYLDTSQSLLAIDSSGSIFTALPHALLHEAIPDAGGLIELWGDAGRTWALDKAQVSTQLGAWNTNVTLLTDAACDSAGHCAVFGSYLHGNGDDLSLGWIEVFAP